MTSPFPGFTAPDPIGWGAGIMITTPRLRGDCTNLAALFAGGARPLMSCQLLGGVTITAGSASTLDVNDWNVNTWQVGMLTSLGQPNYFIPFAGYYLVQANVIQQPEPGGSPTQAKYSMGFQAVVSGVGPHNTDGGAVPSIGGSTLTGGGGCELYQFQASALTGDYVATYAFTNNSTGAIVVSGSMAGEWVGLPSVAGTVVSSPVPALAWPPGPGTYITTNGGIAAGASHMLVADATGMTVGGTLGLDYINGQLAQPYAEPVTITGISGLFISITPTLYSHAQNAPVAVPVSGAFLNQQVRDAIRFLSYPPILRAATSTPQSIATGTSGVQITNLSATDDTFSGFASNQYTVPVSGTYFVYGQVYYSGSTSAFAYSAGVSVNGGTILWGTVPRSNTTSGAQSMCATFRRHLRLTAGQTVALYGFQNSGSSMNTIAVGSAAKLIMVWRSM